MNNKKIFIPFSITSSPIKKLAIINFENDSDTIYQAFELQYFDGPPYGSGWRVLAYRNDRTVDVYDDLSLNYIEDEKFDVVEKGFTNHVRTQMQDVVFEKSIRGIQIEFTFYDINNRKIRVKIKENSKRASKEINLLAPIGMGTEKPTYFPLFYMYNFDFVRKSKTLMQIEIDGKIKKPDNFPFPMVKDFQRRYFTRYSLDTHIIEVAKESNGVLSSIHLDKNGIYEQGMSKYYFIEQDTGIGLKSIVFDDTNHFVNLEFNKPIPIQNRTSQPICGSFKIKTEMNMGTIEGVFEQNTKDGCYELTLNPARGWSPVPNSFLTKIIFMPKSMFCSWPKSYYYNLSVSLETLETCSSWNNDNKKIKNKYLNSNSYRNS